MSVISTASRRCCDVHDSAMIQGCSRLHYEYVKPFTNSKLTLCYLAYSDFYNKFISANTAVTIATLVAYKIH